MANLQERVIPLPPGYVHPNLLERIEHKPIFGRFWLPQFALEKWENDSNEQIRLLTFYINRSSSRLYFLLGTQAEANPFNYHGSLNIALSGFLKKTQPEGKVHAIVSNAQHESLFNELAKSYPGRIDAYHATKSPQKTLGVMDDIICIVRYHEKPGLGKRDEQYLKCAEFTLFRKDNKLADSLVKTWEDYKTIHTVPLETIMK